MMQNWLSIEALTQAIKDAILGAIHDTWMAFLGFLHDISTPFCLTALAFIILANALGYDGAKKWSSLIILFWLFIQVIL